MSSKPSRLLDWCNDDDSGKFTVPDSPSQLAGHISDTPADPKLFNWTWWRISQWLEYLDELDLDQVPDGSTYGKVKVDDLTSGRVDFDKLDGVTTTKTEVNQLSGVDVGGNLTGDILTTDDIQTATNKTLNSPKINEDVVLSSTSTELNILDGALLDTAELNTLNGITATTAELNQLDGVEVGGTASGDIITTDDNQNMYSKTLTSAAQGAGVKRCVLSSELTAYDDRGDATIEPLIEMFSGGYILDLGNELNNPAQNTWSGLRIYAGNTAINAFNFNTSTGNGINIGSAVGRVVHAQSINNTAWYGVYTTGAFTKGFMRGAVESGGAPTHSADSGTFWLSSAVDLYINTDGSTTWEMFIRNLGNLGISANASELNVLDGITSTTAELNILDGVTATYTQINEACVYGRYNSDYVILGTGAYSKPSVRRISFRMSYASATQINVDFDNDSDNNYGMDDLWPVARTVSNITDNSTWADLANGDVYLGNNVLKLQIDPGEVLGAFVAVLGVNISETNTAYSPNIKVTFDNRDATHDSLVITLRNASGAAAINWVDMLDDSGDYMDIEILLLAQE